MEWKKCLVYLEWNDVINIKKYNISIKGHSRGSEKTGFYIPQLKLFFDSGIQSYFEPEYIFITHCHTDHSFALPMLLTGIKTNPTVYVPLESEILFKNFVNTTYQLSEHKSDVVSEYPIIGVKENEIIKLKNNYFMKVYKLEHRVPCCGYGLSVIKQKLRSEYINLPKEEIIKLKKSNVEISEPKEEKILVYLTDTNPVFCKYPEILEYPYIITECSFIKEEEIDVAKKAGHTHWSELKPIILSHPEIQFIIIHLSMRYSVTEINEFFEKEKLSNIIIVNK
jgi:ribonuclease Z